MADNLIDGLKGLTGVFDKSTSVPIASSKLNTSFKKFRQRFAGLTPEQQCFCKVYIKAPVRSGTDSFVSKGLELVTWVSLGVPASSINFRASSDTLYTNIFGGINSPEFINVGYQDFSDLNITAILWDFYYSQFTKEGYRIKRSLEDRPTLTYLFFDFYNDPSKLFNATDPLWEIVFEDVVFKEPQLSGLAPTLGNLSRSFQFSFDRYKIIVPEPVYAVHKEAIVEVGPYTTEVLKD